MPTVEMMRIDPGMIRRRKRLQHRESAPQFGEVTVRYVEPKPRKTDINPVQRMRAWS